MNKSTKIINRRTAINLILNKFNTWDRKDLLDVVKKDEKTWLIDRSDEELQLELDDLDIGDYTIKFNPIK